MNVSLISFYHKLRSSLFFSIYLAYIHFKPDFSLHTGKTFDTLPPPPPPLKRMTVMGILKLFRPPI